MKFLKAIFSRITFTILMVITDIVIVYGIYHFFDTKFVWIDTVIRIMGLLVVLYITNNETHLSSYLIWIIVILLFPIPGTFLYFLLYTNLITSRTFKALRKSYAETALYYPANEDVLNEMSKGAGNIAGQFNYISNSANYPFYRNTNFKYYSLGDYGYPSMLKELKKAKKFIFIEYFIISKGEMWNGILDILKEKVNEGVDVRIMYDDLGSFTTLSLTYAKSLEKLGIKCIPFNRINPIIGSIMNHRDHRKIMVIDGKVAFSGGINLADEYINVKSKYGKWKDNVIEIKGDAVWSYTLMFLTHYNALRHTDDDYLKFRVRSKEKETDGYIAPYGETPLDEEIVSQNVYINILNQASKYCYIFTPYLIIDTEMISTLMLAAKRGVDVRIVTPGVPDKKIVWYITKSFYKKLIESGVKIYEYTPGFIHSKVFVCDDKISTVGTINLDYRSLYLHFENGTYLYKVKAIKDIKDDALQTIEESHQVELKECKQNFFVSIVKLFASLL